MKVNGKHEPSNADRRIPLMSKKVSNSETASVEKKISARLINGLSRRNQHEAAVAISGSKPFTKMFGQFALSNSLYRAEQYKEACESFLRAYREDPHSRLICERLANAAIRSGSTEMQELTAEALIEVGQAAGEELTRIAKAIDDTNGFEAAEKYYWHAFSQWGSVPAHDAIVRGLRKEGVNQWRILEVLERGASLHEQNTSWEIGFASELAKAGRFDEAAARYERISGLLSADQYYSFGYYYQRAGNENASRAAYARAVRYDQQRNAGRYGIGVFHEHHKRWSLAAESYVNAADCTSNDEIRTELYFRAGYCFESALNLSEARRNYDRAVERDPQCKKYWVCSGVAAELAGDYREAVDRYQIGESLDTSNDPELQFRMGYGEFKLGNSVKALDYFAHFVGVESGLPGLEADAEIDDSNSGAVPKSLEISELIAPESRLGSKAHIGWGDTYFEVGEWQAAVRHYDLGFLSGGLPKAKLRRQMESLVRLGRHSDACRSAIEWRKNPEASPLKLESPRRGGYESRNISYEHFRRNLEVRSDIILFESNLGLSVDCHPLEISRHILDKFPGNYIHAWVVDGDVPFPPDLEHHSDVIVVQKGSVQELRLFAIAGYIVNNSTFPTHPVLRDEQRYMNTWHGTPLKAMMRDTPESLDYANISRNFLQATSLIYPSEYTRERILGRTGLGETVRAQVEIIGSPRCDGLFARRLSDNIAKAPNDKVLIAPTWRPGSDIEAEVEKLVVLSQTLQGSGHDVYVRAHHYIESEIARRELPLNIVPRTIPTNDLLQTVDVLVTDYSSIFFDFAITRRPIVFYIPDWDRYRESRGLYLEQDDLPGAVCTTVAEVLEAVSESAVWDSIDSFLERFAPAEDGCATYRAVQLLFEGPTAGELGTGGSPQQSVLLRGEFLANGISAALISMANALSERGVRVGVLTGAEAVKKDPVRQTQLDRLSDRIPIVARVGAMVNSSLQYHARRVVQRAQGAPVTQLCSALVADAYVIEHRRVLGTSSWAAAVEYEGYSEFWSELILASKSAGSVTSIFMHNDIVAEIQMKFPWMERIARRYPIFDNAVSVSDDLAAINQSKISELLRLEGLFVKGARNIIDPIRVSTLAEAPLDSDIKEWLPQGAKLILSVGRLSPEKNHRFLIDVMRKLVNIQDDVRLVICGEGPLRNKLRSQIQSLGLDRFVMLAGQRDSVYALMDNSDLFVLPSLHEGQPIVLLEATALGLPCLTSDIAPIEPFESLDVNMCELDEQRWADLIRGHISGSERLNSPQANMSAYIEESLAQFMNAVSGGELSGDQSSEE